MNEFNDTTKVRILPGWLHFALGMVRCMADCADAWNRLSTIESASYTPVKKPLFDLHAPCPERCAGFCTSFLFVSLFSITAMIINFTASFTGRIEAKHMAKSKTSCHRTLLDYPLGDGALKVGNIFLITLCSLLIFAAPCGVHLCSTILLCKLHFPRLSCMNRS